MTLINIKNIYDFISSFTIIIPFYLLFNTNLYVFSSYCGIILLHIAIKKLTYYINYNVFKRPKNASNCNILNNSGNDSFKPGFRSGHMTSISFFTNYLYFTQTNKSVYNFIFYNIPSIIMAYARFYKKCHNIPQILFGFILGLYSSFIISF